jgi:hypothetical protein
MVVAMTEFTAETYRRRATQARASAATATYPELKRQWDDIAAAYDRLAVVSERAAMTRNSP